MKTVVSIAGKAGVSTHSFPAEVRATIDRELLIVFWAPSLKACSFLIASPKIKIPKLIQLLERAVSNLQNLSSKPEFNIKTKAFGLSHCQIEILKPVETWLKTRGLKITSSDIGKRITRKLTISCETGRVGVFYDIKASANYPSIRPPGKKNKAS